MLQFPMESVRPIDVNPNVFIGPVVVCVELFKTVDTNLGVCFAVMLLVSQSLPIIVVRHVGCRHDEILFQQCEAVGTHL